MDESVPGAAPGAADMHEPRSEASNPASNSVPEAIPAGDVQTPDVTASTCSRNDQVVPSGDSTYGPV